MKITVKCYACGEMDRVHGFESFPRQGVNQFDYQCEACGHEGYMTAGREGELKRWE